MYFCYVSVGGGDAASGARKTWVDVFSGEGFHVGETGREEQGCAEL